MTVGIQEGERLIQKLLVHVVKILLLPYGHFSGFSLSTSFFLILYLSNGNRFSIRAWSD